MTAAPDTQHTELPDHLPDPLRQAIRRYADHVGWQEAQRRAQEIAKHASGQMLEADGLEQLQERVAENALQKACLEWLLDRWIARNRPSFSVQAEVHEVPSEDESPDETSEPDPEEGAQDVDTDRSSEQEATEEVEGDEADNLEGWHTAPDLADQIGESSQAVGVWARHYAEGADTKYPVERREVTAEDGSSRFVYRLADGFELEEHTEDEVKVEDDNSTFVVADEVPGGVIPQHTTDSRKTAERYANGTNYTGETCDPALLRVDGEPPAHEERLTWGTIDARDDIEVLQ